jgi:tetratricopeptide (TPR) repeat protein
MKKICIAAMSLSIICFAILRFFMITTEATELTMDYMPSLREGNTETAKALLFARMKDFSERFSDKDVLFYIKMINNIEAEIEAFTDSALLTEQNDFGISVLDELRSLYNHGIDEDVFIYADATSGIARLWQGKGRYDKAVETHLEKENYSSAAWILATCPDAKYRDGQKALEYAQEMIKRYEEKYEEAHYTWEFTVLAAAYAEIGNFPEAITIQEKAISLLKEDNTERRTEYEKYLASYKEGKPWRIE